MVLFGMSILDIIQVYSEFIDLSFDELITLITSESITDCPLYKTLDGRRMYLDDELGRLVLTTKGWGWVPKGVPLAA
jgi:hypothetical protein